MNFLKMNGVEIIERRMNSMTINMLQKEEKFQILKTFHFDSDRKMMSVICKEIENDKVFLFSKGA